MERSFKPPSPSDAQGSAGFLSSAGFFSSAEIGMYTNSRAIKARGSRAKDEPLFLWILRMSPGKRRGTDIISRRAPHANPFGCRSHLILVTVADISRCFSLRNNDVP